MAKGRPDRRNPRRKRSEVDIKRDRAHLARWWARGMTIKEAKDKLNEFNERQGYGYEISYTQAQQDLAKLRKMWEDQAQRNIGRKKAKKLAELHELKRTYYEEFEKSRKNKKKTRTKTNGKGSTKEKMVEEVEQIGDPRLLDGILNVIAKECEIQGLDAPKKHEVAHRLLPDDNPMKMDKEELEEAEQAVEVGFVGESGDETDE